MPEDPDLDPDELVAGLEQEPGEAPDLTALIGYVGPSPGDRGGTHVRLYEDESLRRWVELEKSAVRRRVRLREDKEAVAPRSIVWVETNSLLEPFAGRPDKLALEFLGPDAELYIEPPLNKLEATEYMKMSADYYTYGMTRLSRRPRWHC